MEIDYPRPARSLSSLQFGPFVLDMWRHTLHRDGERVHLTSKQVDTLVVLAANPSRVLRKQELLDAVWKDAAVTEDNLVQAIGEIRRVLGEKKGDDRFIQTVHRQGYRFVALVESVRLAAEAPAVAPVVRCEESRTIAPPSASTRDASRWLPLAAVGMVLVGVGLTVRFVAAERQN